MIKAICRLVFLLLFAIQISFAQESAFHQQTIDSALVWLNANIVENPEPFHDRALRTLERSYQTQDVQLMGEAHQLLFRWHNYQLLFTRDSILYHGEKTIHYYEKSGERAKLAATYAELAIEYLDENKLKRSEELIFKAIAIYEELEDQQGIGAAYRRLSSVFRDQDMLDLSIQYGLEAAAMTAESGDYYTNALAWMGLIRTYQYAGQLDKAIEAAGKCIEVVNNEVPEQVFILARAYSFRGGVRTEMQAYDLAIADGQMAYDIVEGQIGAERPATQSYREGIGKAYLLQGKYREALPHLLASKQAYIDLGATHLPEMEGLYQMVADCQYQVGNYQEAFLNQALAHEVFDTLTQNRIANLESESLIRYESGRKDQALAEQSTIIEQQTRIQWLGSGLIALLLLFLGTLFYYFRKNQKTAAALRVKNQENELLLKEIHHRVKNNLQVISSLLNIQSRSIEDTAVKSAILASQSRVQSMSLIHQKLYRGKNLAAIEMKSYLQTLADNLIDAYIEDEEVEVHVDMQDLELDVDYAIPVGLIVNELITNSLKYAFPNQEEGAIEIKMEQNQEEIILNIGDNGVGKSSEITAVDGSGFGSELIELLTIQLKGDLAVNSDNGFQARLRFPIKQTAQAA